MFDGSTMKGIRAAVSSYAASFDPGQISAQVAQGVVDDAIAVENMVATIKALAAKRVADTELWKREGDISPAHHLARKAGTSDAVGTPEASSLADYPWHPDGWSRARNGNRAGRGGANPHMLRAAFIMASPRRAEWATLAA